jgi:hypothetical protein
MEREVEDTISVLIQLDGKRGHHPCTVTILWGSLPSRVRRVVGWWKPLQYACRQLAACEKVEELEAGITVDMQMLMEQAFTERSEADLQQPQQQEYLWRDHEACSHEF